MCSRLSVRNYVVFRAWDPTSTSENRRHRRHARGSAASTTRIFRDPVVPAI
ncbi:hypothetical protein FHX40_0060 [Thermopolyspora flexuosa]|jgi:hypothetical protein|uniref:Uncharacterized protein n=1 Tax=Thermopolyspora flexuosa TaxID=103836 RepID=A0A543IS63_9ACTN|nr:hypothetical protein FHX40_0060 [Thermopolyspora flexuosa]